MYRFGFTAILFVAIIACETQAQNSLDSIKRSLEDYSRKTPAEKLYIHLDKPYYSPGDTVWFKIYLLHGSNNALGSESKIIYVDFLRKVDGKVVCHKLLRNENGFARGEIALPDTLKGGAYEIVGYTNWMRNFPNCFYWKEVIIQSAELFKSLQTEPEIEEVADIQFFPEGGNLIAGLQNRVSFKAVNRYGKGIDFKAFIMSEHQGTVATISSQHLGMGSFIFQPKEGEQYHAEIEKSIKKIQFQLPTALANGYTFFVDNLSNKEGIKVITQNNYPTKARPMLICQQRGNVIFALQSEVEGNSFVWMLPKNEIEDNGVVQLTLFNGQGVPQCERLIYNETEFALQVSITPDKSEYQPREKIELAIHVQDQDDYPVEGNFSLSVTDIRQVVPEVNGSNISNYLYLTSEVKDLEGSEIKGTIEQPGYYFDRSNPDAIVHLDILLMTQGWRRFQWKEVLEQGQVTPQYEIEQGITLRGSAAFANGKIPLKPISLILLSNQQNEQKVFNTSTDESGHFVFQGIDAKNEVQIFLQASKDNGGKNVFLTLNKPDWPSYTPKPEFVDPLFFNDNLFNPSFHGLTRIAEPDVKLLNDVVVTARREVEKEDSRKVFYHGTNVTTVVVNQGMWGTATNVLQMLQGRVAGLQVDCNGGDCKVSVRGPTSLMPAFYGPSGPGTTVAVLVDGILTTFDYLKSIPPSSVESIDVVTHPVVLFNAQGLINVLTKNGNSLTSKNSPSESVPGTLVTTIHSYDVPRDFYVPKYPLLDNSSTQKIPDFRSTLFWNPVINTDWEGNAKVIFWNSDEHTSIRATVEGISYDGKPGCATYEYTVK